jgi:hypothetical protein
MKDEVGSKLEGMAMIPMVSDIVTDEGEMDEPVLISTLDKLICKKSRTRVFVFGSMPLSRPLSLVI